MLRANERKVSNAMTMTYNPGQNHREPKQKPKQIMDNTNN